MPRLRAAGCPIRTPTDLRPFAPPRGLSRPAASFLASGSQGILRTPCLASRSRLSPGAFPCAELARVSFCLCVCFHFPILSKNRAGHCPASVENVGLEPTTPGLQSRCSSQLSQSPCNVVPGRLELPTPTLSVWCSNRLSYGTPLSGVPGTRPFSRLPLQVLPASTGTSGALLGGVPSRKEVFQPHLPVRLPCYDLAPITGFTLGRNGLQAPPAFMA